VTVVFSSLGKAWLQGLLDAADPTCPIQFCEGIAGDDATIFAAADRNGA
jgi:hypothetical protein